MPIKLKGKDYKTVAERLVEFHKSFGDNYIITTDLVSHGPSGVVMSASIKDRNSGEVVSSGHAEGQYNGAEKVIEKTETTSVGRALALFHPDLMGTDIASADEIASWVQHGNDQAVLDHVATVRDHWSSIAFIKDCLATERSMEALEAWRELNEDVMRKLWRAPSKGGIFTTMERKQLDEASTEDFKMRKENGVSA